ncbi:hypothetical protein ElyMa_003745900 [Elysia marginata]|uniref:Uncharacterized protein n=1 Tax=Elysia marginata TaxID=1093978 RepID=A0AAV4F759_9GAST|nr:hypothetical protein ElyMa_003745900 [Elysia marginata]
MDSFSAHAQDLAAGIDLDRTVAHTYATGLNPTATSGLDAITSPGQDATAFPDSGLTNAPHSGFVAVPNPSYIAVPVVQTQPLSLPMFLASTHLL